MPFYPIQNSFMAGEISPRMLGRMDTPFYKHGVEFSENFLHLPQGPARLRPGSRYALNARQNGAIRLIPFNTPPYLHVPDYVLELGADGSARLIGPDTHGNGIVIQKSASGQLLLNNDFTQGAVNWSQTTAGYWTPEWQGTKATVDLEIPTWSSDWDPSQGGPLHPPTPPPAPNPAIWQQIHSVTPGPYTFQVSLPAPLDDMSASPAWVPKGVDIRIGTTLHGTDILNLTNQYNVNISQVVTVPGGGPIDIYVEFRMNAPDPPATFTGDAGQVARITYPTLTGSSTGACEVTGLPWTDQMLPEIQYAQDIFFGMVLVHPLMEPQVVTYTGGSFGVQGITTIPGFIPPGHTILTPPTPPWTSGSYPGAVDFWQSRLWLGGSTNNPTTIWASRTSVYTDFDVITTPTPDSPICFILASKGGVKWLRGKQNLLVGTDLHEDVIVAASQVVSSGDAQIIRQSAFGSSFVQAQDIGDQVLFVSREGIKLRSLNFNFDTQAWLAHDITFYAQDITVPGVKEIAFCRDPDNTIYVLCTDGTMRMCTYDRLQEVVAWSRWRTSGQGVQSICATIDSDGTRLWMAVNRAGVNFIEYIPPYTATTPFFMDSYVVDQAPLIYNVGPLQRITIHGCSHLEGYSVGVVIDGVYYGIKTVVGGQVDFPFSGTQALFCTVGIPYTGTLRTLPLDGGVMYGSSAGLVKSRTKIFARLLPGSALPLINGFRPAERVADITNFNQSPAIEDIDNWVVNLGWDRYARVTIVQDIPLETQVAGVFGRAEVAQN